MSDHARTNSTRTRIDRERACRHARRIVGDPTVAEDMVQETLLRVLRRGIDIAESAEFQRYFYRALTNACLTRLRRDRRELDALAVHVAGQVEFPSQIDRLERCELIELVDAALQRLPPRERIAIVLKQWDGRSYRQIGEALGITETHAATLVYRGLKRMRERFEEAP